MCSTNGSTPKPPCPVCGRTLTWRNGVPLRWYCWGTPENEHKEWSALCSKYPPEPLKQLCKAAKKSSA